MLSLLQGQGSFRESNILLRFNARILRKELLLLAWTANQTSLGFRHFEARERCVTAWSGEKMIYGERNLNKEYVHDLFLQHMYTCIYIYM